MALTPYQSAIETSGSGFNQKLQGLLSVGQAIKASQTARQQMQEQLRQQKELIQFRGDTQLENQIEYYNRVTQPANEAEARAAAERQREQARIDSLEAARERKNELIDEFNNDFGALREYNIFTPHFQIQEDPESGMYTTAVLAPTGEDQVSELDYQSYRSLAERMNDQAGWLRDIEEGLENNWFPEEYPEGQKFRTVGQDQQRVERMTRSQASDILRLARENPRLALQERQRFQELSPFEAEDTGDGSGSGGAPKNTKGASTLVANFKSYMNDNGVIEFRHLPEKGGLAGFFGFGEEPTEVYDSVSLNGSMSQQQIERKVVNAAKELYDIDLTKVTGGDEVIQRIIAGDPSELEDENKEIAEKVKELKEDPISEENITKLLDIHFNLPEVEKLWREEFPASGMRTTTKENLHPNFLNVDNERGWFINPDKADPTQQAFNPVQLRGQLSIQ